ncbi:nicotinate-nucleotide--dimethylbenzimidazole phosphoribosyltransferase [Lyngbya aestuarii]|uniref:nicotinate-nucleotide--dimethylbenzimidazole phosphoribosyltransferase n=1 Tax=Lyngbya aestuarii TaxID=118322 RepID=UPI00403E11CC
MITISTQLRQGHQWLQQYQGCSPVFACILGFTATGLIPGISAAGAQPSDRQYTAIADAEFLLNGVGSQPRYPLPPLQVGVSPVIISRAVLEAFNLPIYLFNAGLPQPPAVPAIDLGGVPAGCLSSGKALPLETVRHLFEQGLNWGEQLASAADGRYLIISECVVGGTTTALSVLTGLGIAATGKVNSSHPSCNHAQKWQIVQAGLQQSGLGIGSLVEPDQQPLSSISGLSPATTPGKFPAMPAPLQLLQESPTSAIDPLELVAAVGDPMQIAAAGMLIAASRSCGVLLAGGTQMLAVYALARALVLTMKQCCSATQGKRPPFDPSESKTLIQPGNSATKLPLNLAQKYSLEWRPTQVVVGTTRWVAEDPSGDTVGLAQAVGNVPLLATDLSFTASRYPQLRAYEQGFVKEGVGAGGCAIAAHLYQSWDQFELLSAIETLVDRYYQD